MKGLGCDESVQHILPGGKDNNHNEFVYIKELYYDLLEQTL
jgi:hypothetical protein